MIDEQYTRERNRLFLALLRKHGCVTIQEGKLRWGWMPKAAEGPQEAYSTPTEPSVATPNDSPPSP